MSDSNRGWSRFITDPLSKLFPKDEPFTPTWDPMLRHGAPGVEWTPQAAPSVPPAVTCPDCGTDYPDDQALFCEACGSPRPGAVETAAATPGESEIPTRRVATPAPALRRTCLACGGDVDFDGYCTQCGARSVSERDHYREQPSDWVAGVCDRGIRHVRNEDALAVASSLDAGERAVLVVCDGVSTSEDSDVASLAGAQAARDHLWFSQPQGMGVPDSRDAAMVRLLTQAASVANEAVIAHTRPDSQNSASATFAAAVIADGTLWWATLGDSRVYWFPDDAEPVLLSRDDSLAQEAIADGVPRQIAENAPAAHTITRWLGRDADDVSPTTGSIPVGTGWALVCSDGLWNYASDASALAQVLRTALAQQPGQGLVDLGERLVAWANAQGGQDNISVAIALLAGPAADPESSAAGAHADPPDQAVGGVAGVADQPGAPGQPSDQGATGHDATAQATSDQPVRAIPDEPSHRASGEPASVHPTQEVIMADPTTPETPAGPPASDPVTQDPAIPDPQDPAIPDPRDPAHHGEPPEPPLQPSA